MQQLFKWIVLAFLGFTVFAVIIGLSLQGSKHANYRYEAGDIPPIAPIVKLPTYTATQIADDYQANTLAADQKYKSKQIKITGKVSDITRDIFDKPHVRMVAANQFMEPDFSFNKKHIEKLVTLKIGDPLTLVCIGQGDIIKTAFFDDCEIL